MSKKYLYYFSEGNDAFGGDKVTMKNTLGGKGAGLAEMTAAGMPVPQGFTITTDACTQYYADGRQINDDITADIFEHLKGLEEITGKKFGDNTNPLLVSVRSGARQSMPGMMDTILNLGLNDEAVEGLAKKTGNARSAYDCYRRFVQMFADVVMMVPKSLFEVEIDKMKEAKGVKNDVDLTAEDLKELVGVFKKIYEENEGKPFPQDPRDQLIAGIAPRSDSCFTKIIPCCPHKITDQIRIFFYHFPVFPDILWKSLASKHNSLRMCFPFQRISSRAVIITCYIQTIQERTGDRIHLFGISALIHAASDERSHNIKRQAVIAFFLLFFG